MTEDELHAYVDGELPADRREAVGAWLAANPEQAALVAAWRAQADSIRARYGDVVNEPVPERLQLDQIIKNDITYARARGRTWAAMAAAAALVAFVAGGGVGWYARAATAPAAARSRPCSTSSPPRRSTPTSSTSSRCVIRSKCRAAKSRICASGCRSGSATNSTFPICNRWG